MTSHHWGILIQWTDGWGETNSWKDRNQMDRRTDGLSKVIAKNYFELSSIWDLSGIWSLIHFEMRQIWKKKLMIDNELFQSKPQIHEILQINARIKLFDLDPWNFDTKNVKQCTKGGKKRKIQSDDQEKHTIDLE